MMARDLTTRRSEGRWLWLALVVGMLALAAGFLLGRNAMPELVRCYLVGWTLVWGLGLGSLALVMVHHLTGGVWGLAVRRILEAQMIFVPLSGVLFVPIGLAAGEIYPWPVQAAGQDESHRFRETYFETGFVVGRAIAFFVLWIGLAWLLRASSRQQDGGRAVAAAWKCHNLSGPGLVIYGVTLHFASIDWLMSLELPFTSTIYAPIVAASQLLSAFALAVAVLGCTSRRAELSAALSRSALNDIGNLLLTLVLVWAYLIWCQAMLIWMADLKRDNSWWLERTYNPWRWFSALGTVLGLIVPLILLLFRRAKRSTASLGGIAGLVLLVQVAFSVYQFLPASEVTSGRLWWLLSLIFVGLGALSLAALGWSLDMSPLAPLVDRNWNHARHLQNLEREELAREEALAHG